MSANPHFPILYPKKFSVILCCAQSMPEAVAAIQELRRRLFVDRLGWSLNVSGAREIDQFDTDHAVYCAVYKGAELVGCFRAISARHPYLARTVFPELAQVCAYPTHSDVWEISRLGFLADQDPEAGRIVYAAMFLFARLAKARSLVALVDLCHERLLRRLGIRTRRFGEPQVIGEDRSGRTLRGVAGEIPMQGQGVGVQELLSLLTQVEVINVACIFRSEAVSA